MFLGTAQSMKNDLRALLNSSLRPWQLEAAIEMIVQSFGADVATIALVNGAGELVVAAHRGFSATWLQRISVLRPGDYRTPRDWQSAQPTFLNIETEPAAPLHPELVKLEGVRAIASSPLRYCGIVFGLASAGWRRPLSHTLYPQDLSIFEVIGNMLGTAAAASQLHELDQRQLDSRSVLREKRRSFFEETTDAVLVCDPLRQVIVQANLAAARITGYGPGELEGMALSRLWPEASLQSIQSQAGNQDPQSRSYPLELQLYLRDGTVATVEATTRVALQPDRTGLIELTLEDVTQQRRQQELASLHMRDVIRALEEERKRLAWQLHEETIQSLLHVSRQLQELASAKSRGVSSEARAALGECADLVNATSQQVRSFCHNLRPLILDDLGLVAALKWLTRSAGEKASPAIAFEVTGDERRLAADTELALFRVVQEALNNVQRHAGAAQVRVTLCFETERVTVSVADDGRGFEPPRRLLDLAKEGRMGLLSIHDRVQIVGGTLQIKSEPGKGAELTISVPCPILPRPAGAQSQNAAP